MKIQALRTPNYMLTLRAYNALSEQTTINERAAFKNLEQVTQYCKHIFITLKQPLLSSQASSLEKTLSGADTGEHNVVHTFLIASTHCETT